MVTSFFVMKVVVRQVPSVMVVALLAPQTRKAETTAKARQAPFFVLTLPVLVRQARTAETTVGERHAAFIAPTTLSALMLQAPVFVPAQSVLARQAREAETRAKARQAPLLMPKLPALVLQAPSLVPMTRSALALRLSYSNRRRRYWRCRRPVLALLVRKAKTMAKVP